MQRLLCLARGDTPDPHKFPRSVNRGNSSRRTDMYERRKCILSCNGQHLGGPLDTTWDFRSSSTWSPPQFLRETPQPRLTALRSGAWVLIPYTAAQRRSIILSDLCEDRVASWLPQGPPDMGAKWHDSSKVWWQWENRREVFLDISHENNFGSHGEERQ